MATTVTLEACGGLGPYTWTVDGPAALNKTKGTRVTVTMSSGVAFARVGLQFTYPSSNGTCDGSETDGIGTLAQENYVKVVRTYDCSGVEIATEVCPGGVCPDITDDNGNAIEYEKDPTYTFEAEKCTDSGSGSFPCGCNAGGVYSPIVDGNHFVRNQGWRLMDWEGDCSDPAFVTSAGFFAAQSAPDNIYVPCEGSLSSGVDVTVTDAAGVQTTISF
jgi:hypothetical protein